MPETCQPVQIFPASLRGSLIAHGAVSRPLQQQAHPHPAGLQLPEQHVEALCRPLQQLDLAFTLSLVQAYIKSP